MSSRSASSTEGQVPKQQRKLAKQKKKKKSGPSDHVFTQIVICSKRLSQWREEHPLPPGVVEQ